MFRMWASKSSCKRRVRRTYFHCCYLPLHRKKILCLFLTTVALVMLTMTAQTLILTHSVMEYFTSWNPRPRLFTTNNSNGRRPVKLNSLLRTGKDGEEAVRVNNSRTKHISVAQVRTLKPDPESRGKESSQWKNTSREALAQKSPNTKPDGKGSEVTSHQQGKTAAEPPKNAQRENVKEEEDHPTRDTDNGLYDVLPGPGDPTQHGAHGMESPLRLKRQEIMNERYALSLLMKNADAMKGEEIANNNGETRHVFFLKVHKAASTTVMNIMYRFAVKRHLTVMLPRHGNVLSETAKHWRRSSALPLPWDATHFDLLCNHVVFSEPSIRSSLGEAVKFIGIVREPFQQFVSAFFYYRKKFGMPYLRRIPGADPVANYLENPWRYEARAKDNSYTHNRMSFDFGMNRRLMDNLRYVNSYIHYLSNTFDLVMVCERFDESMVLLKRLLGWRLQDILYVRNNVFTTPKKNYTAEQKLAHRNFNEADYALYEHFERLFQAKVEKEGKLFAEEVATFVALRKKVDRFCQRSERERLSLPPTDWTPEFKVSQTDCQLMVLSEIPFVNLMKVRQYGTRILHMRRMRFPIGFHFAP